MWGIFIAKHNPDLLEGYFGYGPLQLNEYLFEHKIRLDVPKNELLGLFLPHSSLLDVLIFSGFAGLGLLIFVFLKTLKISLINYSTTKYLLIFLLINMLKSDSILYLNSFILLLFTYKLTKHQDIVETNS